MPSCLKRSCASASVSMNSEIASAVAIELSRPMASMAMVLSSGSSLGV